MWLNWSLNSFYRTLLYITTRCRCRDGGQERQDQIHCLLFCPVGQHRSFFTQILSSMLSPQRQPAQTGWCCCSYSKKRGDGSLKRKIIYCTEIAHQDFTTDASLAWIKIQLWKNATKKLLQIFVCFSGWIRHFRLKKKINQTKKGILDRDLTHCSALNCPYSHFKQCLCIIGERCFCKDRKVKLLTWN